ncbi:MAG: response regulator [Acidobacteria bacterium]|nr:response regulator [Acidobacteriota bacterium]
MPKILVADKNTQIQRLAMRILKGVGIDVITVSNGEAAVQKLSESPPDLVLADIFMPVYNGYEVCQFVKKDDRFSNIPVILLYGKYDPFDQKESQRVRADGVLQKPFDPPDPLIGMVKSLLQKAEAAKASAAAKPGMDAAHDEFRAAVPHHEETQQLSDAEIRSMTGTQPFASPGPTLVPTPEPEEPESFQKPEEQLQISSSMGFDEIGDNVTAEAPAPAPVSAAPVSAAPEPDMFIPDLPSAEEPAPEPEPEVPNFGGIEMEMKKPSPDEPPIKVDFTNSEPVELMLEDRGAVPVRIERDPNLASSAGEWIGPPQAVTPPPPSAPAPEMELTASFEAPELPVPPSPFGVPAMEPLPGAPAPMPEAFAAPSPREIEEYVPPPPPPTPDPLPPPVMEEEIAPIPAPSAMQVPPIPPPVLEEALAPEPEPAPAISPMGQAASELPGLEWSPTATEETPPPPVESPVAAVPQIGGKDLDDIVKTIVGQISPDITKKITEEILRRITEGGLDLGKK